MAIKFINGVELRSSGDNTRKSETFSSADPTGRYIFTDYGRLLKRWWKCDSCEGIFYHYIEVCRCCGKDGVPFDGNPNYEKKIIKWNYSPKGWATIRPNPKEYFQFLIEDIA